MYFISYNLQAQSRSFRSVNVQNSILTLCQSILKKHEIFVSKDNVLVTKFG